MLNCLLMIAAAGAAARAVHAAPDTMTVQVRETHLRAAPSYLSAIVATAKYGDKLTLLERAEPWIKAAAASGATGWVHVSALTRKRLAPTAAGGEVTTAATSDELSLAGKGFNAAVEAEFKKANRAADFESVDRMERYRVSAAEVTQFLKEGGIEGKKQ